MKDTIMKTIPLLVLGFFLFGGLCHAADLKDGFLDVKWGASPAEQEAFTEIYEKSGIVYYMRADKVHTVGDRVLEKTIYGFWKDRFFSVHMMIEDLESFNDVRRYMQDKYGTPKVITTTGNPQTQYQWKYKKAKMKLKRQHNPEEMKLSIYYAPISSEVNRVLGEANQEGTVQFLPIRRDEKPARMPLLTF